MSRNVQSLERGLIVLEALVKNGASGVTELANLLELNKTIVHRLLNTLLMMGYVEQDENRKYTAGVQLRRIGAKVLRSLDIRTLSLPYMHQLAEQTQGIAHLATMVESRVIYIERVQHPALTIHSTPVGGEAPGYCSAAGKVIWAYLPNSKLINLIEQTAFRQHTTKTITDKMILQQHLAEIRENGYGVDRGEHRAGLIGVGAPLYDFTGKMVASVCIGVPESRLQSLSLEGMRDLILEVSAHISSEMGYSNGNY